MTRTRLARALRDLADQLDGPPPVDDGLIDRHRRTVVPAGYAQGRADLQLVHAAPLTPDEAAERLVAVLTTPGRRS